MKYTEKIGKGYVTIEDKDFSGFGVKSFGEYIKTFFQMFFGSIILFGLVILILNMLALFINMLFF